jgi:DNA-binding response OmpR family regulator
LKCATTTIHGGMAKILIVEDDRLTCSMIRDWLEYEHYTVEEAHSGQEALELLKAYSYDVVILDWELPEVTGIDILRQYRSQGGKIPVLLLTGKREIAEKEEGLDAGADDYLTKPFDIKELSARVRALLRRSPNLSPMVITHGNVTLELAACRVTRKGEEVKLLPTEYALLEFFMRHPNQVFSTETLLNKVWKSDSEATALAVRTYITRLRKKLDVEGQPSIISTVYGLGYKLGT